jgi:plastocyanin
MRKLVALFVILAFVLALGCAKQAAEQQAPSAAPAPPPPLTQVQPEAEEAQAAPPPQPEAPAAQGTIGTRLEGTEEAPVEEEAPEGVEEIFLTAEKTMTSGDVTVPKGTTLYWRNKDTWPHQLKVTTGSGLDTKLVIDSPRLVPEAAWNFTFNEAGVFTVRDIFSGKMRMIVTVE